MYNDNNITTILRRYMTNTTEKQTPKFSVKLDLLNRINKFSLKLVKNF